MFQPSPQATYPESREERRVRWQLPKLISVENLRLTCFPCLDRLFNKGMDILADEVRVDIIKTGKNIARLMELSGHSLEMLSDLTGLSKSAIRNYINGKNPPSLRNLGVIAYVYDINISQIIAYTWEG